MIPDLLTGMSLMILGVIIMLFAASGLHVEIKDRCKEGIYGPVLVVMAAFLGYSLALFGFNIMMPYMIIW